MMTDYDDPDLELSPYTDPDHRGQIRGQRRPVSRDLYDLDGMGHRKRIHLENYGRLVRGGCGLTHREVLARLGLTEHQWAMCVLYAERHHMPIPAVEPAPPLAVESAWHCSARSCAVCNRTEVGRCLHTKQHTNRTESEMGNRP